MSLNDSSSFFFLLHSAGADLGETARAAAGDGSDRGAQQRQPAGGAVVMATVGRDYVGAERHRASSSGHHTTQNTHHRTSGQTDELTLGPLTCAGLLLVLTDDDDASCSQMFMEEMTRKQPDVDKVTKTYKRKPAEAASLSERRGAREDSHGIITHTLRDDSLTLRILCRQAAAAAGGRAGSRRESTTQPALCPVAAGVAAGSRPPTQAERRPGPAGGGSFRSTVIGHMMNRFRRRYLVTIRLTLSFSTC